MRRVINRCSFAGEMMVVLCKVRLIRDEHTYAINVKNNIIYHNYKIMIRVPTVQ